MDQNPDLQRIAQSLEKLEQLYTEQLRQSTERQAGFDKLQKEFEERRAKLDVDFSKPRAMTTNERVLGIVAICLMITTVVQVFLLLGLR